MNLVDELIEVRRQKDALTRRERALVAMIHDGKSSSLLSSDGTKKASISAMSMWNWDDGGLKTVLSENQILEYRKSTGYRPIVRILKA